MNECSRHFENSRYIRLFLYLFMALPVPTVHAQADTPITAVALAPDGKQVVLGSQRGIEIRMWPDMAFIKMLPTKLAHVHDLKFSPDGLSLLAAGGSPAESGSVEVWSWPGQERLREVYSHDDVVYRVAWSPNGKQWVTCSADARCLVFSEVTAQQLTQYNGHSRAVLGVRYLDDQTIASVGVDQTVRLWNSADGTHLRTLVNHLDTVNDVSVRPTTGERTADVVATIAEDRTLRLWQPRSGRLVRFVRLTSVPRSLLWSGDAAKLYVGCNDGRIRIIDAESLELEAEIDALVGLIHDMVIVSSGDHILTVGARGCRAISLRAK